MSESKSERNQESLNSQVVPFFARYLEGQFCEDLSEEEMKEVQGGKHAITLAYPSDQEGGHEIVMTKKYPSDKDEDTIHPIKPKSPLHDVAITNKYPSDGDDHNFIPPH
jgi:hypothetical protein